MNDKIIKIGVTGGIGSGKTFVSRYLEKMGIPVFYTDTVARELMNKSPEIRNAMIALLGCQAYDNEGKLNKQLVASYLFSDPAHAKAVNHIVHPVVRQAFEDWVRRSSVRCVAMECAILYESGFDCLVDYAITVTAPLSVRLERIIDRDSCSLEQAQARINAQISEEERCAKADFVLNNDGCQSVQSQLHDFLNRIGVE